MNGIYGIINFDKNPIDLEIAQHLSKSLEHRNKNGTKNWHVNNVFLGCHQTHLGLEDKYNTIPFHYKHWIIVSDAFLYNRTELIAKLQLGHIESPITDTELIIRAYDKWGNCCPKHIEGAFVFAIWDTIKETFYCARDGIGEATLSYWYQNNQLIFSSEVQSIAKLPHVNISPNDWEILRFLTAHRITTPPENTFINDIKNVCAGNWLKITKEKSLSKRFFYFNTTSPIIFKNKRDYPEALKQLIIDTIKQRARTDYPIGIMLSGGLDSSGIAVILARYLAKQGKQLYSTSSVPYDTPLVGREDDKPYIESILKQEPNINHSYASIPHHDYLFQDVEKHFSQTYSPVFSYFSTDELLMKNMKQSKNVRLFFNGSGGDRTVSYSSKNIPAYLLKNGRILEGLKLLIEIKQQSPLNFHNLFKQYLIPFFFPNLMESYQQLRYGLIKETRIEDFLVNSNTFEAFNLKPILANAHKNKYQQKSILDITNNIEQNIIGKNIVEGQIRGIHQGMMRTFPYYNKNLIEFLANIPPNLLMFNGQPRGLYREAMKGILPNVIRQRTSKGVYPHSYLYNLKSSSEQILSSLDRLHKKDSLNKYLDEDKLKYWLEKFLESGQVNKFEARPIRLGITYMIIRFLNWLK